MIRLSSLLALGVLLLPPAAAQDAARWEAIGRAKARIYPALVNIGVVTQDFQAGRTVRDLSAGSGTIISAEGHVLTNYHVARDASSIVCTLPTGEQIPADLVGEDPPTDLSVLKLRLGERRDPKAPLPFAMMGDSDTLQVGDHVLAVGNPLSLSSSMTLGIVSNTRRVFADFRGNQLQDLEFGGGNRTGMFTVWIQHDALILPGNSGGPLVNLKGEIVGVNTRGGSGYGFASPANLVKRVVAQILENGRVRRGWLGLTFQPVSRLGRDDGALVAAVIPTSPAAKAGVHPGDILLSLGGKRVSCRFLEEVPLLYGEVADLEPGTRLEAVLLREGAESKVALEVAPMADFVGERREVRQLGITLQAITEPMALARRYPDAKGVVVTGIKAGESFEEAKPQIRPGDVVLELGGRPVADLAGFLAALAAAEGEQAGVVFRRDREVLVTMVKLDKKERPKPGGELAKPWLGVRTQVLTPEVAKALGLEGRQGFRLTEVYPWTKAAEAGLQVGDVLLSLDEEPLKSSRPQDAKDLQNRIEELAIGEEVTFGVLRGGQELPVKVELEESPASSQDAKTGESKEFEVKVRELTFMDRIERKLDREARGVLVTEVTPGGWANLAGLASDDLVLAVAGTPVLDAAAFTKAMAEAVEKRSKVILVFVQRGFTTTFCFIEPDWARAEAGSGGGKEEKR